MKRRRTGGYWCVRVNADMQVHACAFVVVCVGTSLCVRILHACVARTARDTRMLLPTKIARCFKWYTLMVGPNTQFALYELAVSFGREIAGVCSTSESGLQQLATHAF